MASLAETELESDQLGNGLGVDDGFLDVIGNAGEQTYLARIEKRIHDGTEQHVCGDKILGRLADQFVRLANDLPHLQATTRKCEGAEVAPVVATALGIDLRGAPELTRDDEQYLF